MNRNVRITFTSKTFILKNVTCNFRHWWDEHSCIREYLFNKLPQLVLYVIFYLTLTVLIKFFETVGTRDNVSSVPCTFRFVRY